MATKNKEYLSIEDIMDMLHQSSRGLDIIAQHEWDKSEEDDPSGDCEIGARLQEIAIELEAIISDIDNLDITEGS